MAGRTPEETDRLVGQAIADQDIEALLDLFEPNAVFIDPTTGAEARGHDDIRAAVLEMFEANPRIEEAAPARVWVAEDIALVLSSWSLEMSGPDGDPIRETGTATDVMRKQTDGSWRYVIDNPGGVSSACD